MMFCLVQDNEMLFDDVVFSPGERAVVDERPGLRLQLRGADPPQER